MVVVVVVVVVGRRLGNTGMDPGSGGNLGGKKRRNETPGAAGYKYILRCSGTLEAILIPISGGAWCAMMAVTPESSGLNSPSTEDQWGNFLHRGLKASWLLLPCFPGSRQQLFAMLMSTI